jgi:hypothetical protein
MHTIKNNLELLAIVVLPIGAVFGSIIAAIVGV